MIAVPKTIPSYLVPASIILVATLAGYLFGVKRLDPAVGINLSTPEVVDCVVSFRFEGGGEESVQIRRPRKVRSILVRAPMRSIVGCTISGLPDSVSAVSLRSPLGTVLEWGPAPQKLSDKDAGAKRQVRFDWKRFCYWMQVERVFAWAAGPVLGLLLCFAFSKPSPRMVSLLPALLTVALSLTTAAFVGVLALLGPSISGNLDSTYMRALLEQSEWRHPGLVNSGCPFEGLYTLWNGQSYTLSPAASIAGWVADVGGRAHNTILYLVVALEFLLAFIVLCKSFGIPLRIGWGAGMVALFLIFPTRGFEIHQVTALIVFSMEFVALVTLFLCAMMTAADPARKPFLLSAAGCAAVLAYISIYDHLSIVLAIPMFIVFGLAAFWSRSWRDRLMMAAFLAPIAILVSIVLKGQKDFSQTGFFDGELLNDRQSLFWVSILFQNVAGACVVVFGLAGAVAGICCGEGVKRRIHVGTIVYTSFLLVLGGWAVSSEGYIGPSLLYFEFVVWPLYFLGIAELVYRLVRLEPRADRYWSSVLRRIPLLLGFVVVCVVTLRSLVAVGDPGLDSNATWDAWPPAETEIIRSLKGDLQLQSEKPFRGYAYTQTVLSKAQLERSPYPWIAIHLADQALVKETGNDHRAFGLVYHGIPTAFQFGGLMSPRYYFCFSRIMGGGLEQMRSRVVTSELNPTFLRMIGVARVVSNQELSEPFRSLPHEAGPDGGMKLRLFALDHPNLGDYSPTDVRVVDDAMEVVEACRQGTVDFRKTVFLEEEVEGPLSEAVSSTLVFEKCGIRVQAKSEGKSLVVLPVEFSHCMEVRVVKGGSVRAFPANLVATGLLFEGEVEVLLSKRFGVLQNPLSLVKDARDFEKILK